MEKLIPNYDEYIVKCDDCKRTIYGGDEVEADDRTTTLCKDCYENLQGVKEE